MINWQGIAATFVLLLAVAYIGRRGWLKLRAMSGRVDAESCGSGCSGCGGYSGKSEPVDFSLVNIVPSQRFTTSR
jgi:FeoB-associated Cys-rich membrane protein